jgi:hypothetical protein
VALHAGYAYSMTTTQTPASRIGLCPARAPRADFTGQPTGSPLCERVVSHTGYHEATVNGVPVRWSGSH